MNFWSEACHIEDRSTLYWSLGYEFAKVGSSWHHTTAKVLERYQNINALYEVEIKFQAELGYDSLAVLHQWCILLSRPMVLLRSEYSSHPQRNEAVLLFFYYILFIFYMCHFKHAYPLFPIFPLINFIGYISDFILFTRHFVWRFFLFFLSVRFFCFWLYGLDFFFSFFLFFLCYFFFSSYGSLCSLWGLVCVLFIFFFFSVCCYYYLSSRLVSTFDCNAGLQAMSFLKT